MCKSTWEFSENPGTKVANSNILKSNINYNSPVNSLILLAAESR